MAQAKKHWEIFRLFFCPFFPWEHPHQPFLIYFSDLYYYIFVHTISIVISCLDVESHQQHHAALGNFFSTSVYCVWLNGLIMEISVNVVAKARKLEFFYGPIN
jgi:hypothetical protein